MLTSLVTAAILMQTPKFSPAALRATVEHLASYETRNTTTEGHKIAVAWLADELRKIPGVEVEIMKYTLPKSRRVPEPMEAHELIATIKGKTDRIVMMGGHIDSINMTNPEMTGKAPGANDDASGVACAVELCKAMAGQKWENTIKLVAFSGEEQGLLGSAALAQRAKDEGWQLEAVLSNDMIGNSGNNAGQKDDKHVRVFSEEGDNQNSRELARWIEWKVRHSMDDLGIKLVFRRDRFGRGGDHTPFVAQGFNAVRFVEVYEEYSRQHTPDDLPKSVDFDYLAKVTRANYICLSSLANAAPTPTGVRIVRDQAHDTTVRWTKTDGVKYQLYYRDTASPIWEKCIEVGNVDTYKVDLVNKDDNVFAVAAEGGIPVEAK